MAGEYVSLDGMDWAGVQTRTDDELEASLYKPPLPRFSHQLPPDFATIHQ
ncbi:MAG: hypothetical protein Q8K22_06960 [Rhodoferax sp.]|nr:hypothetical protein [Rhodoferax sp.]